MKYISLFIALFIVQSVIQAQVPQKMSYQAIVRDANGELLRNTQVGMSISILESDANGAEVYKETHEPTTNNNGLVSIEIGGGAIVSGSMETINWGAGPFYLKSETDPEGGINYSLSGTSELISVPYALYALRSGGGGGGGDSDWIEDIPNDEVRTSRNIVLQIGQSQPFRVNTVAPAGVARLIAGTSDGIGVQGNTDIGYGVRGQAGQGVGVHGVAGAMGDGVLGEAANGNGVHGKASGTGVLGESELNNGVAGISKEGDGVYGFSESGAGIYGVSDSQHAIIADASGEDKAGILASSVDGPGIIGISFSDEGIFGLTEAIGKAGVVGNGGDDSNGVNGISKFQVGVRGISEGDNGTEGESKTKNGVKGITEAEVQEIFELGPSGIATGTGEFAGVLGNSQEAYGGFFNSDKVSGAIGLSTQSNGLTGKSKSADEGHAGIYGGATSTAAGVLGWSVDGSGVKGKSNNGIAGEFEGEVHIENGNKNAKLKIDDMETDKNAPVLVWSDDMYVRKREGWTIDDTGDYFESSKGIVVYNGDEVVFRVNPDGTSFHRGLESFEAGLVVPSGNVQLRLLPGDGISVFSTATNEYLFHANTMGNAFAAESFSTKNLSATVLTATEKNFRIDHPLDPENKDLYHTSIESDERLNIYSGNIITDSDGNGSVTMPAWFEALNMDFRYQLTVIGEFAQAIVYEEIENGTFSIKTSIPKVKVSWQVSGVRHDRWARENPTRVEVDK